MKDILTISFATILLLSLGSCKETFIQKTKSGIYLRIVNIDTVSTTGYIYNLKYKFSGLMPGDTSSYQLIKDFNTSYNFEIKEPHFSYSTQFSDCRTCNVDTPLHITISAKLNERGARIPKVAWRILK